MVFPILARALVAFAPMAQKYITQSLLRSPLFHAFVRQSEIHVDKASKAAAKKAEEFAQQAKRNIKNLR